MITAKTCAIGTMYLELKLCMHGWLTQHPFLHQHCRNSALEECGNPNMAVCTQSKLFSFCFFHNKCRVGIALYLHMWQALYPGSLIPLHHLQQLLKARLGFDSLGTWPLSIAVVAQLWQRWQKCSQVCKSFKKKLNNGLYNTLIDSIPCSQ